MSRWVVERTSTTTQLQVHAQIQVFERQDIGVDQLLDFNLQGETVLNVMTLCPLMKGTKAIRSPMSRQFLRYRRRWSSLDKVFPKQGGQKLCILHWDRIILRCLSLMLRMTFHHAHFMVFPFWTANMNTFLWLIVPLGPLLPDAYLCSPSPRSPWAHFQPSSHSRID